MKRPSGISDVAWYDIERAWLARDAEHRAELAAAQATIEQLGKDAAAIAAKLDRAVAFIQRVCDGDAGYGAAEDFLCDLAAPSPAESTPAQPGDAPYCTNEACTNCSTIRNRPVQPAPPDDIRARLDEALENIERMKERYSEQSRELVAMEQERDNWRQQRVDIGIKLDLFAAGHKGQGCGRREGDAALEANGSDRCARADCGRPRSWGGHEGHHVFVSALEAKGEPGTHAFVDVGADGCCAHFETNEAGFKIFCGWERGASIHGDSGCGDHDFVEPKGAKP